MQSLIKIEHWAGRGIRKDEYSVTYFCRGDHFRRPERVDAFIETLLLDGWEMVGVFSNGRSSIDHVITYWFKYTKTNA